MKTWLRHLVGLAAAVWACGSLSAQSLIPISIAADPGSVKPGGQVTFSVGVNNLAEPTFSPPSTADFSVTLTNIDTGYQFTLEASGVAPKSMVTGLTAGTATSPSTPGTGSFDVTVIVPTETTEAGPYRASVSMSNASSGSAGGSFSSSDSVLTVVGTPDLRITSLTYPAGVSYKGGDWIPMTLNFTNVSASGGKANVPWTPSNESPYFRIEVVLSTNPTFGDGDDFLLTFLDVATKIDADNVNRPLSWNQLLPGNFAGSYYVLARIDVLSQVAETTSDDDFTINGNNVWYDTRGSRIGLQPTSFPTVYLASAAGGASGNGYSDNPVVSADARYTAFVSDSTNLGENDTNALRDIFFFDNQTSAVRRINVSQQGVQANGASSHPAISGDGRYVAFASDATNLVFGDSNGFTDIFVVDTVSGTLTRESVTSSGGQANGSSFRPAISADGRYVAFESNATNLASAASSGVTQIYLRDRNAGTVTLVSQSGGVAGNAPSLQAAISADGRYVAFASDASNLALSDANGVRDIFVRDVNSATTTRVSVSSSGTEANGPSHAPSINRNPGAASDGRYIAFASEASNLVANDTNAVSDIFVADRVNATTTRVSVSSSGVEALDPTDALETGSQLGSVNPSISATGRYVAFASLAANLTAGDAAGRYTATDSNNSVDVFVRDRDVSGSGTFDTAGNTATQMVSVNRFGYQTLRILGVPSTAASDIFPAISGDGRWVAFPTDSDGAQGLAHLTTNRVSNDQNAYRDIFLFDRRINALPNPVPLPSVRITSPANGSFATVDAAKTLTAEATTPNGTIQSVQFFADSKPIGEPVTTPPYSVQWTPPAEGVYRLTAMAFDSAGAIGVSDTVLVMGSVTSSDAVAAGSYQGRGDGGAIEGGNFAVIASPGKTGAFIGYSTTAGANKAYFFSDIPVDAAGGYALRDDAGNSLVAGTSSDTGTTGTLDAGRLTFIGVQTQLLGGTGGVPSGFYSGSLTGRGSSTVAAIVGADGSIVMYVKDGSFVDAGGGGVAGKLNASGAFDFGSQRGNRFSGRVDRTTRLLTGSLSGANGGSFSLSPANLATSGGAAIVGADIRHANGNVYDQVLLVGDSASITAAPGKITRVSFVDLSNDITQIEFSGAGSLAITLDNATGPAGPALYNQPGVSYMKGHAGIVVTGANETTNLSVFSVGRMTAVNQALFREGVAYDGMADIAYVAIFTTDGKFGGLRTANASYFATRGPTGVLAPGVQFTGPVFVGDITAADSASPVLLVGSASDVRVTGGDLLQNNGQPLQVSGVSRLQFVDGTTSHGSTLPAQFNRARLEQNGQDVAAQLVANPGQ